MSSPASIAKHPIHPMLVALPIGLWIFSFVCDLAYVLGSHAKIWTDVAYYCIGGGVVGALLAAVPGLIDFLSLKDPKAKKIGTAHMILNLLAVFLFAINFVVRMRSTTGIGLPITLSAVGLVTIAISGWLGGELVYVHGVAVEPSAIEAEPQKKHRLAS